MTSPPPLSSTEWQSEFAQSLFKGLSEPLNHTLNTQSKIESKERFSIYQNNVFYSLTTALGDLYPTIKKLVGEEFFNGTSNAYIRQHPPAQAAMVYFGSHFPQFLSNFEHTKGMPYLADVAQLELARHRAYHAADKPTLNTAFFAAVGPEEFEESTVELHPSLTLLSSAFPIFTIWQSNQETRENIESDIEPDNQATINLDEPEWLIVVRVHYEVLTFKIDYGIYLFYKILTENKSIIEAANFAQQKEKSVDISSAIALGIENQFFTNILAKNIP